MPASTAKVQIRRASRGVLTECGVQTMGCDSDYWAADLALSPHPRPLVRASLITALCLGFPFSVAEWYWYPLQKVAVSAWQAIRMVPGK